MQPSSSDEGLEDYFFDSSLKAVTQNGDPRMEELFESAKRGNVDDFVSLVRNLKEDENESVGTGTRFPPGVIGKSFDLFVMHVRKRCIRGDYTQLKLAANSLTGLEILWQHHAALWTPPSQPDGNRSHRDWKFAILWTDIFHWLEVLEEALFSRDIDEDTAIDAITNSFVLFRDLDPIHTKPIFNDPDVFKLAYRLWLRDLAADEGHYTLWSEPLAIACTKQVDFNEDNAIFLDAALEVSEDYGEPKADGGNGGIARIAIRRLFAFLEKGAYADRVGRVMDAVTMLWLIAKENDPYGNKKELSSNPRGLPSVVRALNVIANATFVREDQMDAMHRGLDLLQSQVTFDAFNDGIAITDRMVILLQSGILTTIVNIQQSYVTGRTSRGHEECMLLILLTVKDLLAKPHTTARISAAALEDVRKLGLSVTSGEAEAGGVAILVTVGALLQHITSTVLDNSPAEPPTSSQPDEGKIPNGEMKKFQVVEN